MFLDSEPEVIYPAIESNAFGLPLMARKRTATLLYSTEEVLTVLEFFAVGDLSTAVLLRAVKGGVNLPQTNISAIFKVHLSLFLIAQFFITQLTLPFLAFSCYFYIIYCFLMFIFNNFVQIYFFTIQQPFKFLIILT
ncbi:hypothetical protein CDL21_13275 [Mediterraneibacter gnavus]|nr:hypothetical protein CCY17_13895 [Mediterraneibacter gnavus]PLT75839.1 hypothetical protein CDL24_11925 [Mediterraneibacter gnavus]PLT78989.1 hypothetical protein CDL21_13275 [Mediterraneibacter gnavus]RHB93998.1 hypothetical protein DW865_13890 [Mediterraneibacter gnavus]